MALTVAYLWRFWSGIFLGRRRTDPAPAPALRVKAPVPALLVMAPAVLAAPLLPGGFLGGALARMGRAAAAAVHGTEPSFELAYHLDLRLTHRMALGAWLLGAALVASRRLWAPGLERVAAGAASLGPARLWELGLAGLNRLSDALHRFELHDLRDRLASIFLPAGAVVLLAALLGPDVGRWQTGVGFQQEPALGLALAAAAGAAVAVLLARSHLGLVLLLSGVGYSLAVVFALLGGPDLALVAVLVETALTLLFLVALTRLPGKDPAGPRRHATRWHTVAAVIAGGVALVVAWAGLSNPAEETIATEHVRLAEAAHAKNVLAAILADFRALDTLGETTVLVVALLGLLGLLGGRGFASGGRP